MKPYKKKKIVIIKKKAQPVRKVNPPVPTGTGDSWDKWNKGLNTAIDKSVEAGRKYITSTFKDIFGEDPPIGKQTYRLIGLKIAYHLQEQDCIVLGRLESITPELRKRFVAASKYDRVGIGYLAHMDSWGLDVPIAVRQGRPENLIPKAKSETRTGIEEMIIDLGNGKYELTCGEGTKGVTVFKQGTRAHTVEVVSAKHPFVYDLNKDWDRNVLYGRLWRWSRREDILS